MQSVNTEERREILAIRVRKYTARGWLIQHQTNTTAQLIRRRRHGCLARLLFGVFLLLFPQNDTVLTIEVDENGQVRERRTKV